MMSALFQQAEIFRPRHVGGAQKPADNAGVNFFVFRDDYRPENIRLFIDPMAGSLTDKRKTRPREDTFKRFPMLRRYARHTGRLERWARYGCAAFSTERICTAVYPARRSTSSRVPRLRQDSRNKIRASFRFSWARSKLSPCVLTSRLGQEPIQYFPDGLKVTSTGIIFMRGPRVQNISFRHDSGKRGRA